ncbi:type II secretion system F family protein [Streptomonospora nanhaiensis]|uniref:type II secretion system F family protein n=1 Tax=Streptomonospora nanhaiensis TaxID=1323731 RepID=UPI0027E07B3C|nr:type II secretion system F family protein [Streptomonospora nanhaiensis]
MNAHVLLVAAAAGGLAGAGLVCCAYAARLRRIDLRTVVARVRTSQVPARGVGAVVTGVLVGLATGWPVGAVLAAAAAWWLPRLLGPDRAGAQEAKRAEAVAAWASHLRDLMAGSAGLVQAITATAPVAPTPIRPEVAELARSLHTGVPMEAAMRSFAERVDNPTADLVAVALSSAEGRHASDLGALLGRLAESSRDRASLLVRTSAGRARVRSSVRIIAAMTLGMVAAMVAFNRTYLEPLDTATGQFVLALVGAMWAGAFVWLGRLAAPVAAVRLLGRAR